MRLALLFVFLASPVFAWEFTASPICTLSHSEGDTDVVVTYDPSAGLYSIAISTEQGWPPSDGFSIRFDGANPLIISTRRHAVSDRTLTVTDTGFGNVLNGLAFNSTATAFTATAAATVSLDGAQEPVADFRACVTAPSV